MPIEREQDKAGLRAQLTPVPPVASKMPPVSTVGGSGGHLYATFMQRLACWLGYHDWRLEREIEAPAVFDADAPPSDYVVGGVDYHLKCARCPTRKVDICRGVWLPRKYKPL